MNALRHGLTSQTALLPSEDPDAYRRHADEFFKEYQPEGSTEKQLVRELADTSWRLNRVPAIEAALLQRASDPATEEARINFDIVDALHAIASLGLLSARLSRQFQKTLEQLRALQAARREQHERDLKRAAALLELHKVKGTPFDPALDGFLRKYRWGSVQSGISAPALAAGRSA
jgi:hypothetical protein